MSIAERICETRHGMIRTCVRIIFGILCFAFSVFLCACGKNTPSNQTEPNGQISPTSQEQISPSPQEQVSPSPQATATEPPQKGSCSLFIYMCGSDLETKQGIASKMLKELMQAKIPEDMYIIVETGGAKTWRNLGISSDATERYQIKDGKLILIERLDGNRNMGASETFSDFVTWCDRNYPAERNMLILWDHGAGSANGICFDENYSYDSLDLKELHDALANASLSRKYDIIGFDACLMASAETMIAVHDFADYMIASQEIEPSSGWDLKNAAETFSRETDPVTKGKTICDNYIARCKEKNSQDSVSTMSLIDLSKTKDLLERMQIAFEDPRDTDGKELKLNAFVDSAEACENFGTECAYGVFSNMIDLRGFVFNLLIFRDDALAPLLKAIDDSVLYIVNCAERDNSGLSLYYPNTYNEKEIASYLATGPVSNYNRLLRSFYTDIPENTITFSDAGSVSEDGAFTVSLTPESIQCLKKIYFELYETDESGRTLCIGRGRDFSEDWDTLSFKSNFRGTTVSMGGHRLYYEIDNSDAYFKIFYAPLRVNGELHKFMFCYTASEYDFNGGYYISVGIQDGYDEHGIPQRDFIYLKNGDRIRLFDGIAEENGRQTYIPSEEYSLRVLDMDEYLSTDNYEDTEIIYEVPLDGKTYRYAFVVEDFFGNTYKSDVATFEMTKTYEELLENPLTNGNYAAVVTGIEPGTSE